MATEKQLKNAKICPVCGTKLTENATRCLVCGTQLGTTAAPKKSAALAPKKMPEFRVSLPLAIALGVLFLALIGVLVFFIVQRSAAPDEPVGGVQTEGTATSTPTRTLTPTPSDTPTPLPTWTPLPPVEHVVKPGETCYDLVYIYDVSLQSIIRANGLDQNCTLSENMRLNIPQPTLTPSPMPSNTPLPASDAAAEDDGRCDNVAPVRVEAGWTLSRIAAEYHVTIQEIMAHNRMPSQILREGDTIEVPLCDRRPAGAPTPTPTPLPPYPAPNLLLPASGASFAAALEGVTLQWASVGELKGNELYRVTVQDLTQPDKLLVQYVHDTKFIIPGSFRPTDPSPHIIQWTVSVAKQTNAGDANPTYVEAGATSEARVFSWMGSSEPLAPTATP